MVRIVIYLFNEKKAKGKYHIWTGVDTKCRMWSTGGIKKTRPGWQWVGEIPARDFCQMCIVNEDKRVP